MLGIGLLDIPLDEINIPLYELNGGKPNPIIHPNWGWLLAPCLDDVYRVIPKWSGTGMAHYWNSQPPPTFALTWRFSSIAPPATGRPGTQLTPNMNKYGAYECAYIYIYIYLCIYLFIYYRRKFGSQTSDNMERWKSSQQGEESEEKRSEERRCRCAKR